MHEVDRIEDIDELEDDEVDILSDEFAEEIAKAGLEARQEALAAGHYVVFRDEEGRCVQELPDGRLFEVEFDSTKPRETHMTVLRELNPVHV